MTTAITLSDAVEEYIASRQAMGLAKATVAVDKMVLKQFLGDTGNIYVRSIEPKHLDVYFANRAKSLADSSRNLHLARLRGFFAWCLRRNYSKSDPTLERRQLKIPPESLLLVPPEQFEDLLDATEHPRDRILVAIGLYLFLRASEIMNLRVQDVDLDAREITVRIPKTRDLDTMPICEELEEELRRWLTWYAANIEEPLQGDMYLVPAKDSNPITWQDGEFQQLPKENAKIRPYRAMSRIQRPIQMALASLGYPTRKQGGHTLRRSGARALFDVLRETDHEALQRVRVMLHHKSVQMTEHYLQVTPERESRNRVIKGRRMFPKRQRADNVIELRRK